MHTVSVARDFTRYPSGRYMRHGTTSGEEFRKRFLEGPLSRGEAVEVDLDGTVGFGSSFLDEAFGGVTRALRLTSERALALIHIRATDTTLIDEVREYIVASGAEHATHA